ncbi:hypothetical protein BDV26DRAFT_276454 [Aspergillus bertholletiae]|uniref:Uncharacterized protein n=1 Tax=Aspergillus bertholletiae TaxID=1226010 RepID=A0A5N7AN33_9EURO|nr:hypothetical protein BDV26DRAFT_276454 [Aspergillus bertholletiae]
MCCRGFREHVYLDNCSIFHLSLLLPHSFTVSRACCLSTVNAVIFILLMLSCVSLVIKCRWQY